MMFSSALAAFYADGKRMEANNGLRTALLTYAAFVLPFKGREPSIIVVLRVVVASYATVALVPSKPCCTSVDGGIAQNGRNF